jgi:hypothetical protein
MSHLLVSDKRVLNQDSRDWNSRPEIIYMDGQDRQDDEERIIAEG